MKVKIDDMAAALLDGGHIQPPTRLSSGIMGKGSTVLQASSLDEDASSRSSSNATDLFDRKSVSLSQKGKWQLDASGTWQRYGSTESAPSTAISSLSSSVGAEDQVDDTINVALPSKKRMSDGTFKQPVPTSTHIVNGTIAGSTDADAQQLQSNETTAPMKRKRGRPSKVELARRREEAGVIAAQEYVIKPRSNAAESPPRESQKASPRVPKSLKFSKQQPNVRPRSSIPSRLPADIFASQCIEAAFASRLDPYSLHAGENNRLSDLLMSKEVTVYLNIRNAVLRLWTQNPLCCVTMEEALGCAKEARFFGLAEFAHKWLTRNGYINFGCVQVLREPPIPKKPAKDARQRTVVVIGAGVSGLTTARQLENLFAQGAAKWINAGERPPRVIVLEGRRRIGGRVYSKPLRSQVQDSLPGNLRNTAEMGAMIVTGFEHGNPLDIIIRGQLGLRYHLMRDALTIYDCDGKPIEEEKDMLNTELYTDISDRAGEFRAVPQRQETLRGDEDLINRCRDPAPDGFTAFQLEPLPAAHIKAHKPAARRGRRRNAPPGTEKLTGRSQVLEGGSATQSASRAVKNMGWEVRPGVAKNQTISLHRTAHSSSHPTLGSVMDEAISQYQELVNLQPVDMRLLNWHHANLEYANAAPVTWLSLSGHDQDTGNEFEGAHSEIIGGYTQLPRGLMSVPSKLDVRFDQSVKTIHYDDGDATHPTLPTRVVCTNGDIIDADQVVITAPLGVLKQQSIDFDPPLPPWKQHAVERLGFGLLNKVHVSHIPERIDD